MNLIKIYNSFLEIEKIIEKVTDVGPKTVPVDLLIKLQSSYIASTKTLVDFLLVRINTKIRSEKDALILYNKAINSMEKIHSLQYYFHNWIDEVDRNISSAEMFKSWLTEEFTQVHPDINKWFDDIIEMSKTFKNQFLSEDGQKTKEPSEKSG